MIYIVTSLSKVKVLDNYGFHPCLSRQAVMVGQWGVPALVVVFATIYWILGIAKYLAG